MLLRQAALPISVEGQKFQATKVKTKSLSARTSASTSFAIRQVLRRRSRTRTYTSLDTSFDNRLSTVAIFLVGTGGIEPPRAAWDNHSHSVALATRCANGCLSAKAADLPLVNVPKNYFPNILSKATFASARYDASRSVTRFSMSETAFVFSTIP